MSKGNLAHHPVRRGLDRKLLKNNTAILADTLDLETLSMHNFFSGSVLTPARLFEALGAKRLDYSIWLAAKNIGSTWPEFKKDRKACIARVIDQLFFESAKSIGDRIAGPYVVLIACKEHDDMSSIVETAQKMHSTFAVHGVPRESVIVSIPATEAGILAAQQLQKEGMVIGLHFVTTLVHAQACVEAGVSAIFVSVGPLLDVYERRRETVYHNLSDHPGIETLQTILAYFKVNGIKTKVVGADFRNLAEIGLLSECDAVCVSAEHANELSWSQAPTASFDLSEEPQAVLRARQAKYPTDLLTRKGGFSTWFSPESRSLTSQLLHDALNTMQSQMKVIEHVVEKEMVRRFTFQIPFRNLPQVGSPFKPKGIQSKSDKPSDDEQPSLQWDFRLEERPEMDGSANIAPAS